MTTSWWLGLIIGLSVIFDFLNGVTDSGALVATLLSTGAASPRRALAAAAIMEFVGPFVVGTAVASTIGTGIVSIAALTPPVLLAALVAANSWNLLAWRAGLPTSSTHALIGSILGAAVAGSGTEALLAPGIFKVLFSLLAGPILGGFFGYYSLKLCLLVFGRATTHVNQIFKRGQVLASMALALGHGAMDSQKTIAMITLALFSTGMIDSFAVPLWATAVAAAFLALGVHSGGWYTMRKLANKIYRVRPIHGFIAQASAAIIVLSSAILGAPLSVGQVVSSAIVGAGASERISKVRWGVAGEMIIAWVLTMPATAIFAGLVYMMVASVLQ